MEDLKLFEKRKQEHIRLALNHQTQNLSPTHFDRIGLKPVALPELNFSDVSLNTKLLGHKFSSPHFISSMTAGHKQGFEINTLLAKAAAEKNWLFCIGSQKKELLNSNEITDLKKIVKSNPRTKFVSNIGLEEVIQNRAEDILKLAESISALGIIVHMNALQEVFQNKSDVKMKNGLKSIEQLCKKSTIPIIAKEVGFGISKEIARRLFDAGVDTVDVAGSGGTHWGMIEALRQPSKSIQARAINNFADWGMTTVDCLKDNLFLSNKKNIWASGGIRSGVDSAKCLALGARAVGLAQPILKSTLNAKSKLNPISILLETMEQFDFELKTSMFCLGIENTTLFSKSKVWYEKQ